MSHPQPSIPVRITFPASVIPCPNCGLHYTRDGRFRRAHCRRLMEQQARSAA